MTPKEVEEYKLHTAGRFILGGLDYTDLAHTIWPAIKSWDDWLPEFVKVGDRYAQVAEKALAEGNRVTAGEAFWKASMYYQYAQFTEWHSPRKTEVVRKKVEAYRRAAPLVSPPAEYIEKVKFEGVTLPAYLRLPPNKKKPPLVVLIEGLESTKEEFHAFSRMLLDRGMATLAFDGPGQNEVWYHMKARYDYEKPTMKVVDYLETRGDVINTNRLGVLGQSLGGYYAPRAAAFEKRFKACLAISSVDFDTIDTHSEPLKGGWQYVSGSKNWEETREFFKKFTLKGVAEQITCPFFLLHGDKDPIFPTETAKWLAGAVKGPVTFHREANGIHCCNNMQSWVRPVMADWLAKTLKA